MKDPTYGLIGRGRVAMHMAHYLRLEKRVVRSWHREEPLQAEEMLSDVDVILLAINDDAITPFLEAHPFFRKRSSVHFSGSLKVPGLTGLHPLMSFGPDLYDLETYRSIPFIEEIEGIPFSDVFPSLPNPTFAIHSSEKAFYHALCVIAGNGSTLLWARVFGEFERRFALGREFLFPYLQRVFCNLALDGNTALTGALARGDKDTISRDLEALEGSPFEAMFRALLALAEGGEVGV